MKNLSKRGKIYYLRANVNGRRISQSLQTGDKSEAQSRARILLKAAKAEKWEDLKHVQVHQVKRCPAIGEILKAYEVAASARRTRKGNPRLRTANDNACQLQNLIRKATGLDDLQFFCVDMLTPKLLDDYADLQLAQYGSDQMRLARGRRTIYSTIRQGKAVFSRWALQAYSDQGLALPDLQAFLQHEPVDRQDRMYRFPPIELVQATESAGEDLKNSNPDLHCAYILCHDLGMRAGAAAAAQWDWIETTEFGRFMCVERRADWLNKNRDYRIRIADATYDLLTSYRSSAVPFILKGQSASARANLIERDLAKWMRALGWDFATYKGAAHELRKLAGARWYTNHGLEVAAKWMGDNPDTVYRFYADIDPRKHPAPVLTVLQDVGALDSA